MPDHLTVRPTPDQLARWADQLVPTPELWYADEALASLADDRCEVIARTAEPDHARLNEITYVNTYEHWRMPGEVSHIILSAPGWIQRLSDEDRQRVIHAQARWDRGLRFPRSHFGPDVPPIIDGFTVDDRVVICHSLWSALPPKLRQHALLQELPLWDDAVAFPVSPDAPARIRQVANRVAAEHGANCLSTTAWAITADESIRTYWMHQTAFQALLDEHGFHEGPGQQPLPCRRCADLRPGRHHDPCRLSARR